MRTPGPLLASGRDADIFEYGPNVVLRRSRHGRSMTSEARTMAYLRAQGFPVPAIEEVSDDGSDLVMERIHGPSMVEALGRAPWTVHKQARALARLHCDLHNIAPPDFLGPAPLGQGDRLLHLDLHPLNVIIAPTGPVVIDWTNACVGDPSTDVAVAWVLMAAGAIPGGRVKPKVLGWARSLLVNGFLAHFDRNQVARQLRAVVAWKSTNPNMSTEEVRAMWRLAERSGTTV
ncbi:MAG TPA: phosphotransferase [Acidimicrobiales bacterium]|nr:phosphotransferase [Acidimicrobiales bacterium]